MYRLYIGFRLLGEFKSIRDAKIFAAECGETGVFNLMGDNYRDSWYGWAKTTKEQDNE